MEQGLARVSQLQAALQDSLASLASGLDDMNLPGARRQPRRLLAHEPEAGKQGRALQGVDAQGNACINAGLLSPRSDFCCSGKRFLLICRR